MPQLLYYPDINCSVGCAYCFNSPDTPNIKYDPKKMIASMDYLRRNEQKNKGSVALHGGEPLLLPIEQFVTLIKDLKKHHDHPGLQTSLAYLSDEHIKLIKEYQINVGISIDGPPELNILRGPRNPEKNKKFQKTVVENIYRLREEKISFGSITVLSKVNASLDKIDTLIEWAIENKIKGRFNGMFVPWHRNEPLVKQYELTPQELKSAFLKLAEATFEHPEFRFALAHEFRDNLLGKSLAPCIVARCDYLTTHCLSVLGDGSIARCDRCFQDGYYLASTDQPTRTRSDMLGQTECKGCRYFCVCGGGCPGEPLDNDIRRKTRYCEAYYALYEFIEKRLRVMPEIILATDIDNYYEEFQLKHKKFEWWYNIFRKPNQKPFFPWDKAPKKEAP